MMLATGSWLTVPTPLGSAAGVKTSVTLVLAPVTPSPPPTMSTRPSGRRTSVGYQRPTDIWGCTVHFSVNGLNVRSTVEPRKVGAPWNPGYVLVPPATTRSPFARNVWPAHQMLKGRPPFAGSPGGS